MSRPAAFGSVIRRSSCCSSGRGGSWLRFEHALHCQVVALSSLR